jgi:hypothetical protein
LRVIVSQDHHAPGSDVVDVPISIDVVQISAVAALKENRLSADTAERAGWAVDAAWHQPTSALVCGMAARSGAGIAIRIRGKGGHQGSTMMWGIWRLPWNAATR